MSELEQLREEEARELLAAARRQPGSKGWSVFDSHFYDWLRSEQVQPESIALIKFAIAALSRSTPDGVERLREALTRLKEISASAHWVAEKADDAIAALSGNPQ